MMMSMKRVLPKTLPFVLIVFAIFTVSLTENLQIADGLAAGGDKMIYQLNPGESQLLTWLVMNDEDKELDVEFYATGPGSELLIFEEYLTLEPNSRNDFEIFVSIPKDHKTDVEFRPSLFVLHRGEGIEAGAGIQMNIQMQVNPTIKIGDNPIYTYPVTEKVIEDEAPKAIVPEVKTIEEKEEVESLEDKMARIQEANQAKGQVTPTPFNVPVDDEWEESFEEEAVKEYVPEPTESLRPAPHQEEEKNECGFIDWLLSLFGMAKC